MSAREKAWGEVLHELNSSARWGFICLIAKSLRAQGRISKQGYWAVLGDIAELRRRAFGRHREVIWPAGELATRRRFARLAAKGLGGTYVHPKRLRRLGWGFREGYGGGA